MPDFQCSPTILPNTEESDPLETQLKVDPGVIIKVYVDFPSGNRGLTGCRIFHNLYQFGPSTPGEYYYGDDRTYNFKTWYPVQEKDNVFTVKCWNTDTEKNHDVIVRLIVLPEIVANPLILLLRVLGPLAEYLVPGG
jgi:hypothetical protein